VASASGGRPGSAQQPRPRAPHPAATTTSRSMNRTWSSRRSASSSSGQSQQS